MSEGVKLGGALGSAAGAVRFVEPLAAMALAMPTADHPNKMPFSGVLTLLNTPSDRPPNGSKGRRVIMRKDAAERAIPSLLGMAVNYTADASGHDVPRKVGVITAASVKADAVHIDDGVIWAADFPKEADRIRSDKDLLGFSWEIANVYVENVDADPLVVTDFDFTGAAILRKDKAAYSQTRLAAEAEEINMTKEELAAAVGSAMEGALKPVTDRLDKMEASQAKIDETLQASAQTMGKVEPHAKRIEDAADKMEADGVGSATANGHVKVLRGMASSMRADAAQGRIPSSYGGMYAAADPAGAGAPLKVEDTPEFKKLKDELGVASTKVSDLQAAAEAATKPPARKTRSPEVVSFLSKSGVSLGDGEKMSAAALTEALKNEDPSTRLRIKAGLKQAGLVDA